MKKIFLIIATLLLIILMMTSCTKETIIQPEKIVTVTETVYSSDVGSITLTMPNEGQQIHPGEEKLLFEMEINGFEGFASQSLRVNVEVSSGDDLSDFFEEIRFTEKNGKIRNYIYPANFLDDNDMRLRYIFYPGSRYIFDGSTHIIQCWGKTQASFPISSPFVIEEIEMDLGKDDGNIETEVEFDTWNQNFVFYLVP